MNQRPDDRAPDDRVPQDRSDGPPAPPWVQPDAVPADAELRPRPADAELRPRPADASDDGPSPAAARASGRGRRVGAIVVASAVIVAAALGVALVVGGDDADDTAADGTDDAGDDTGGQDADDPGDATPDGPADGGGTEVLPDPDAADPDSDDDPAAAGGSDREVELPPIEPADDLDPPDLTGLRGSDEAFAEVLVDVDASERTMIRYQQGIVGALLAGGSEDPVALIDELSAVANTAANELESIRGRLTDDLDDVDAREVRDRYVDHLDSWVAFMRAVQQQPALLGPDADTDGYTLAINVSADAFARSLQDRLPSDADVEVARYADEILDRGFRSERDAQV